MSTGSTPIAARTRSRSKAQQQSGTIPEETQPSRHLTAAPAAPPLLQVASPRGKRSKALNSHPIADECEEPAAEPATAPQPPIVHQASQRSQQPVAQPRVQAGAPEKGVSQPPSLSEEPPAPSAKEIAAAAAARARLAGERPLHGASSGSGGGSGALPTGPEPMAAEVECPATAELQPLDNPTAQRQVLQANVPTMSASMAGLPLEALALSGAMLVSMQSKDWVELCRALTMARRLVAHHTAELLVSLDTFAPLLLAAVRSLRSSVCKAAIMCTGEAFAAVGEDMIPLADIGGVAAPATSLLHQLLLKAASNDKRFVVEEAQLATSAFATRLPPQPAMRLLLPYTTAHKAPKVRGQAARALAKAVQCAGLKDVQAFGVDRLLAAGGALISDNTPEARTAARGLLTAVQTAWQATASKALAHDPPQPAVNSSTSSADKENSSVEPLNSTAVTSDRPQALLSGSTSPKHNSSMGPSQSASGAASATFSRPATQQGDRAAPASAAAVVPPWKRRPVGGPESTRARVTAAVAEPGAMPALSSRPKVGLAKGAASSQLGPPRQQGSAVACLTGWEAFCRSNLSATAANAVLRATAQ